MTLDLGMRNLSTNLKNTPRSSKVVTIDEAWAHRYNPETNEQSEEWLSTIQRIWTDTVPASS